MDETDKSTTNDKRRATKSGDAHVYLGPERLQYLRAKAAKTGRTFQGMVRWIIDEYAKEWPVEQPVKE